jgi:hypothetical protein
MNAIILIANYAHSIRAGTYFHYFSAMNCPQGRLWHAKGFSDPAIHACAAEMLFMPVCKILHTAHTRFALQWSPL